MLKDPNNVIVCQDEVHFQLQTNVTRTWCPIGTVPVVGSAPGKESVAYSGFVILGKGNGHLFVTKPERFNYLTTIESIEAFLAAYPMPDSCKIFMIMDNAPWHKKAKRLISEESDARYQQIRNRVTFLPIPPYSPDLNPIEQVWRKARREVTHNTYFPRLNILVDALDSYFSKFARANIELATLCTFNFDKPKKKVRIRYTIGNRYAMKISSKRPKPCVALVPYTASNHASAAA